MIFIDDFFVEVKIKKGAVTLKLKAAAILREKISNYKATTNEWKTVLSENRVKQSSIFSGSITQGFFFQFSVNSYRDKNAYLSSFLLVVLTWLQEFCYSVVCVLVHHEVKNEHIHFCSLSAPVRAILVFGSSKDGPMRSIELFIFGGKTFANLNC